MRFSRAISTFIAAVAMTLVGVSELDAQVIGTFRWQFAPFCNVVTLTVEQKAGSYVLSGFDDMCGAPQRAPANGTAQPNPDGTIGIGVTVLRPDGIAVHHTAALNLTTLGGTWFDNYANTGTFAFNAPSPSPGGPRPVTVRGAYAIDYWAPGLNSPGVSTFSFGLTLQAPPQVHLVAIGGPPIAACAGTPVNPAAAPGHLCVYETIRDSVGTVCVARTAPSYSCGAANKSSAGVFVQSASAGTFVQAAGTWAVTVP